MPRPPQSGRETFAGGPEIQLHVGGDAQRRGRDIEVHGGPARDDAGSQGQGRAIDAGAIDVEVGVVADDPERAANCGVDGPAGPAGRVRGPGEGPGQERADPRGPAPALMEEHQLGVRAEAGVGEVDAVEDVLHHRTGGRQIAVRHHEADARAQGAPVCVVHRSGPPVVATPVPCALLTVGAPVVVVDVVVVVTLVPVEATAVEVTPDPSYVTAARADRPPVATTPKTAVPMVRLRRRRSARDRASRPLSVVFMPGGCLADPFGR